VSAGEDILAEAGTKGGVLTSAYCVPAARDGDGCAWKVPSPWNTKKEAQQAEKDGLLVWIESDDAYYLTDEGIKKRLKAKLKGGGR